MRFWTGLRINIGVALLLFFISHPLTALGRTPDKIVFDIDWTIVTQPPSSATHAPERLLRAAGQSYKLRKWVPEAITALANDPGVELFVFSGGQKERNLELLGKIKLVDRSGRSFLDVVSRVFSEKDLTELSSDTSLPFHARFRKDLTKITPDMSHVILVDDHPFSLQPDKTLLMGFPYSDYDRFAEVLAIRGTPGADLRFVPADFGAWFEDQNKFARIYAILRRAILARESHPGESFSDLIATVAKEDPEALTTAGIRELRALAVTPLIHPCARRFLAL